ncbi:MAG TPA: hypothetical protein VK821_19065 [Dehalococcoidia bacterium]|nr:hypothetical protein [Dehalococcoidia bacterium]
MDAIKRLRGAGLSRHDAIHAIGCVLTAHMNELMARQKGQYAQ